MKDATKVIGAIEARLIDYIKSFATLNVNLTEGQMVKISELEAHDNDVTHCISDYLEIDLYPWSRECLADLLSLSHTDYLKAMVYLKFKLEYFADRVGHTFDLDYKNMFGDLTCNLIKSITSQSVRKFYLEAFAEYPLLGIPNSEHLNDPAMFNWMGQNYLKDSVVSTYRQTVDLTPSNYGSLSINVHSDKDFVNGIDPTRVKDGIVSIELTETPLTYNLVLDKFYIVTKSTEDCKILEIEPYNLQTHHNLKRGERLNGFLFKLRPTVSNIVLTFISNGLESSTFTYDLQLLGIKA